jgi:hypothetical protein
MLCLCSASIALPLLRLLGSRSLSFAIRGEEQPASQPLSVSLVAFALLFCRRKKSAASRSRPRRMGRDELTAAAAPEAMQEKPETAAAAASGLLQFVASCL